MKFVSSLMRVDGKPRALPSKAVQEMVYASFIKRGASWRHSLFGHTLAPLLNRLAAERIAFKLTYNPGGGWAVERISAG